MTSTPRYRIAALGYPSERLAQTFGIGCGRKDLKGDARVPRIGSLGYDE